MSHRFLFLTLATAAMILPASAAQTGNAPAGQTAVDPFVVEQARGVIARLATALEDNFVFPETGKAYAEMLRSNLADGAYASFPDAQAFADKVSSDLQAVHKDGHLRLHVVPAADRAGPPPEGASGSGPDDVSAVERSGWLADGVAYVEFRLFPGNDATADALGRFLVAHRNARTLIVDVRRHRGGGLREIDLLLPALFTEPATLVQMDTREAVDATMPFRDLASVRRVAGPAGVVRREHVVAPAADPSGLAQARVFLLVSGKTASAAEHLALALKRTGRAVLDGETTRGAGHYGAMIPMDEAFTFAAFIPIGRTFDPDTGKDWEGVGVTPDVAVAADRALDEALRLAGVPLSGEAALAALR